MMIARPFRAFVASAVVASVLGGLLSRASTSINFGALPQNSQAIAQPSPMYFAMDKRNVRLEVTAPISVWGEASYFVAEQELSFRWFYRASDGKALHSFQSESVRFWPTEVTSCGPNRVLVSGVDPSDGSAVIEIWSLAPPRPFPQVTIDAATGQSVEPSLKFQIVRRRQVAVVRDQGPVYRLFQLRGADNKALVQFGDSRHLSVLDLNSGSLSIMFAATSNGSDPVRPELANVSGTRWCANHADEGYVYYLGAVGPDAFYMLFDHDRDGEIDVDVVLTHATYESLELDQASKYLAWY